MGRRIVSRSSPWKLVDWLSISFSTIWRVSLQIPASNVAPSQLLIEVKRVHLHLRTCIVNTRREPVGASRDPGCMSRRTALHQRTTRPGSNESEIVNLVSCEGMRFRGPSQNGERPPFSLPRIHVRYREPDEVRRQGFLDLSLGQVVQEQQGKVFQTPCPSYGVVDAFEDFQSFPRLLYSFLAEIQEPIDIGKVY